MKAKRKTVEKELTFVCPEHGRGVPASKDLKCLEEFYEVVCGLDVVIKKIARAKGK